MKTKIIYISGAEIFSANDIRLAFDEVRVALNLDSSTVLFGVPVDSDDCKITQNIIPKSVSAPVIEKTESSPDIAVEIIPHAPIFKKTESSPDIAVEIIPDAPVIEKKPRAKKAPKKISEPKITEPIPDATEIEQAPDSVPEKTIPILSILSGNRSEQKIESLPPEIIPNNITEIQTTVISETTIKNTDDGVIIDTVKISDSIIDDMPVVRDTLEQLLEKMTPLNADTETEIIENSQNDITDSGTDDYESNASELDATLAMLASEFAEKQDDMPIQNDASPTGKIGKLKNILPFKKSKREDSGLMGDLFGWAGIAANDDDFQMPGFFGTSKN